MHTISVTVRTLDGRKADLAVPEDAHLQEVRSAAEAELMGSFRLLVRVSKAALKMLVHCPAGQSVEPAECMHPLCRAQRFQGLRR